MAATYIYRGTDMKKVSKLFTAFAWGAISLALSSEASAAGGQITFSGALVNPSCQLNVATAPAVGGVSFTAVNASQCGNLPATFSTTVNVSSNAASIGSGIANISVQDSAAGHVLEVIYN